MPKKSKRKQKKDKIEGIVSREIIKFLKQNPNQSFNHKQISSGAGLKSTISSRKLVTLLEKLAAKGKLQTRGNHKYGLPQPTKVVEGPIELFRDGFGFVPIGEGEEDIFVPPGATLNAMSGDIVKVKVSHRRGRNKRPEGKVLEVVERAKTEFVGLVQKNGPNSFMLVPDNSKIPFEFVIPKGELHGAKAGEKVVVKFIRWERKLPEAKVIRIIGQAGDNNTEMHAILLQFGFKPEFPREVEEEAEAIPKEITNQEVKKRRDMRETLTFTIDPKDAKDFDDALSYKRLKNGNVEVGVHIADVSHYVRPGTLLDKEAQKRATSVYLVDRTIPMLPEALSNFLCSLRPHEDKLAFSAVFEMDENAAVIKSWFGRTVIHSDHRFTYEGAQERMEAGDGEFASELTHLNKLAKTMRKRRFKRGAVDFEEDEVKFELDEKGKPIRVYRKVRKDAHKLIEEFMLLANRKVPEFINKLQDPPPFYVYRIHDKPDEEKLLNLRNFVRTLGYDIDLTNDKATQSSLNNLMTNVFGRPEQSIIYQVAVRSMAKAIYSTANIGHYGLSFRFYSHFTSPIRRYPDVLAHRLLQQYLDKEFHTNPVALEEMCKHSSKMEKKAADAERASVKQKQVEFLEDKIGQEFAGIVSGVTNWGIYVELEENKCEGMISVQEMMDDYYELDEKNYCLRGRRSGDEIHLGDRLKVKVLDTNSWKRTIDFVLVEMLEKRISPNKP